MLRGLPIKLNFFGQTVLKIINCLQEPAVPWLLALTRPLAHLAHGARDHRGETGPTIELIVAAQKRESQAGRISPVTIDRGRRIAIFAIMELGVEDHGQGHLTAVV
jgi:hypothetical protein